MNRSQDRKAAIGFLPKLPDNSLGILRVKSTCWLVKKDQGRLGDQFLADRGSSALATGNATLHPATNHLILALSQVKPIDDKVHSLGDLILFQAKAHPADELKDFFWSQDFHQRVFLLNVGPNF